MKINQGIEDYVSRLDDFANQAMLTDDHCQLYDILNQMEKEHNAAKEALGSIKFPSVDNIVDFFRDCEIEGLIEEERIKRMSNIYYLFRVLTWLDV